MPGDREYNPETYAHVDADAARRRSVEVVNWARKHFSEKPYQALGRELAVRWRDTWEFDAYASCEEAASGHDLIAISAGVPIALHDDAESFISWTEREIGRPLYDEIYEHVGLGKLRGIPPELDKANAIDRMFRLTMAWLYLHEQAHLFQRHGDLPGMNALSNTVEEFDASDRSSGVVPAVRHACELAADFEASILTLQLMVLSDDLRVRPSTLWVFFTGLTCMFQRFYGQGERALDGDPVGSHPPPSYRIWLTRKAILGWLNSEDTQQRFSGPRDLRQPMMLLDHASVTASMYWNARYKTGQQVEDFLSGAGGMKPVGSAYQSQVASAWRDVWPAVRERHFGWGGTILHPNDLDFMLETMNQ